LSTHGRPLQHWSFEVQAWPAPVQVLVWHVPVVEPVGIEHEYPVQQSAVLVQADPCGWHASGGWQVVLPGSPMQRSEQQSLLPLHNCPLALHAPPSGVPASGVPASVPPPLGGVWQAYPVSVGPQVVPEQQSFAPGTHVVPAVLQLPAVAHRRIPSWPGRHAAPPQHSSLKLHSFPAATQHPGWPV